MVTFTALTQVSPPFTLAGELAALGAAFLWAISINLFRHYGRVLPPYSLNLFKCAVGAVCLSISTIILRPPWPSQNSAWLLLLISGIVGLAIGDTAFFTALKHLGAHISSAGLSLSPVFTALIAALALNEKLNILESAGVAGTVTAVFAVIYFGRIGESPMASLSRKDATSGIVFVFIAAISQAVGLVVARKAFQDTHALLGTLLRMSPALLVLLIVHKLNAKVPLIRQLKANKSHTAILAAGAFGGTFLGVFLLSVGTKYTKAGVAAALSSTFPIWVIPIAHVFFKERTNTKCILSTLIAVAAIFVMLIAGSKEETEKRLPARAPEAAVQKEALLSPKVGGNSERALFSYGVGSPRFIGGYRLEARSPDASTHSELITWRSPKFRRQRRPVFSSSPGQGQITHLVPALGAQARRQA